MPQRNVDEQVMLAPARPAVYGRLIGFTAGGIEGHVGDHSLVGAAEELAAVVAHGIGQPPIVPCRMALRALPGHLRHSPPFAAPPGVSRPFSASSIRSWSRVHSSST